MGGVASKTINRPASTIEDRRTLSEDCPASAAATKRVETERPAKVRKRLTSLIYFRSVCLVDDSHSTHKKQDRMRTPIDRASAADLCRGHGIPDAAFYKWRSKYGGMEVPDARKLVRISGTRGYPPRMVVSDNGTEPTSNAILK